MHSQSNKILIIGPAWVGDMVMAQTLFIVLKQNNPECIIDVIAPNWSRPLLERMPEVRRSISLPVGHGKLALLTRFRLAKHLRQECYDHSILLPNSFKSALIPRWAKIPRRTGWRGEMRYGLLNDMRILDKEQLPLMIQRFIALGLEKNTTLPSPLPRPQLRIDPKSVTATLNQLQLNPKSKPVLALCPGAQFGPAKKWPEHHYAAVANEKISQGWQVWIFGSDNDSKTALTIAQQTQNQVIDLTGKTSLGQAIDLLSTATMVVSNDSGLMHIGAALNRPLAVVYGSSSPKFTPPLNDKVKILSLDLKCSPCFKRQCPLGHLNCLHELKPSAVLRALDDLA